MNWSHWEEPGTRAGQQAARSDVRTALLWTAALVGLALPLAAGLSAMGLAPAMPGVVP